MKSIRNKKVPNDGSVPNRADLTIPDSLSICPSGIKGAGNGVWTEIPLEKGVLFGPYDGVTTKVKAKGETSGSWVVFVVTSVRSARSYLAVRVLSRTLEAPSKCKDETGTSVQNAPTPQITRPFCPKLNNFLNYDKLLGSILN